MNWLIKLILNIFTVQVNQREREPVKLIVTRTTEKTASRPRHIDISVPGEQQLHEHSHWIDPVTGISVDPDSFWGQLRHKVFVRDKYTCRNCGSRNNLTVDHIVELSLGGTSELNNLQTLCKTCHQLKHGGKKFLERDFQTEDDYGAKQRISKKLRAIMDAMEKEQDIQIKYKDFHEVRSLRTIRPLKIARSGKNTYIKAYCRLDDDIRIFRLSRLTLPANSNLKDIYIDKPILSDLPPEFEERFSKMFS